MQLTMNPLKISELPSEEEALKAGQEILDSLPSWKKGKSFHNNTVKTCSRPKLPGDGAPWHCRMSVHGPEDATFDEFWRGLGENKAENEKEFISDLKKVKLVKQISPSMSIWTLYYTFTPPVSPRVFTVLQVTNLDTSSSRKTGTIVSISVNLSSDPELEKLEEKGVKAQYCSVERLQEMEGNKVDWTMAVSSTVAGLIPNFIAEMSMDKKISDDVPDFIKWSHGLKK